MKKNQLEFLDKAIVNGLNRDKFLLQTHEAGLGKTLQAEKSMVDAYFKNKRNSLFVVRFNKHAEESKARIEQYIDESFANTEFEVDNIVLAINSDNKNKTIKEACRYPIVIITHERYKIMSHDKKQYNAIAKSRFNLIVDEEINMLEQYLYDSNRIKWFESLLPRGNLKRLYDKLVFELETLMDTKKGKTFYNCKNKMENEVKKIKRLINYNITPEYANQFTIVLDGKERKMTKSDFLNEVHILNQFLNYTCVLDSGRLYSYNHNIKYWLLENNIYMDANGFNYIYSLASNIFNTKQKQSRIVDHSNWEFHWCNANSTNASKERIINYYDEVNKHIKEIMREEDKILVVSNKEELESNVFNVDEESYHNYFGNITGSNTYRDANISYIPHNPNAPLSFYILKYLYYVDGYKQSRKILTKDDNFVYKFSNKAMDKVRKTHLAAEIYQAIKRINRDNSKHAKVYIINNDEEVINIVKRQLVNIEEFEFELDFKYEKSEKEKQYDEDRFKDSYAYNFIEYCGEILKGEYTDEAKQDHENNIVKFPKKWFVEKLKLNPKKFSNQISNNDKVISFTELNNIKITNRYIIFQAS